MRRSAGLLAALAFTGCATMINRPTVEIPVVTDPPGAVVSVNCGSAPIYGGLTPVTVALPRAAEDCSIILGKEGYEETEVRFSRDLSRAAAVNNVPGVVLGTVAGALALLIEWETGDLDFVADAYRLGRTVGSMPGNAIDRKTGAAYRLVPGEVVVTLTPLAEPEE